MCRALYVIGEAVDVTGWLGGYNFQWAWASGWAAAQALMSDSITIYVDADACPVKDEIYRVAYRHESTGCDCEQQPFSHSRSSAN